MLLKGQEQQEGVLGNRRVVDARGEEQRKAHLGAGGHVDLVDTDAILAEHFQPRASLLEHPACDRVVATDIAIDLTDRSQRVGFAQRPPGRHNLPAGFGEEVVVAAGCVLKRGCGQQDAGWGYSVAHTFTH